MSQSLAKNMVHLVFSTKGREPALSESVCAPLCAFAAGVLQELDSPVIAMNAWRDHVHILFVLSKNHALSQVVMEVKRATSKWLKARGPTLSRFYWQAGYGAFSVSQSNVEKVKEYIAAQAELHRTKSFQEELRTLLRRYQMDFDEAHLWD